jgi:hypothetical protein
VISLPLVGTCSFGTAAAAVAVAEETPGGSPVRGHWQTPLPPPQARAASPRQSDPGPAPLPGPLKLPRESYRPKPAASGLAANMDTSDEVSLIIRGVDEVISLDGI